MDTTTVLLLIIWGALVLLFLVVEMFLLEFTFLMMAIGAAGGLAAVLLHAPWWASVLIAAAVALLLLALVKPRMLRALGRGADPTPSNVDALIGMGGTVVVAFTGTAPGQVALRNGETWSARILPQGLPAVPLAPPLGTPVVVTAIEGSTAVVRLAERTTTP